MSLDCSQGYCDLLTLVYCDRRSSLHLTQIQSPPAEARQRFATLVTINALDYKFKLIAAFQNALNDQEVVAGYLCTRHPLTTSPAPH